MVNISFIRSANQTVLGVYILLMFAEYVRPGFVSTVINVHAMWFLIAPLTIFLATQTLHESRSRGTVLLSVLLGVSGIVLALMAWNFGDVFGVMRVWFALAVGITPLALMRFHR